MSEGTATLDIGHSNIDDDLENAIVNNKYGKQNFLKTLNNYVESLQKSLSVLSLLKDSIDSDEVDDIEFVSLGNALGIRGDQQLIDRFVGFGIANYYDSEDEDDSEDEYNEYESD